MFSELNTPPGCASVNASPRRLPVPTHHSRPRRLAKSYLVRLFHSQLPPGFCRRTPSPFTSVNKVGAEVTVVENGQLAVDAALTAAETHQPFDVILMDMQMPVLDGYEATALLRAKGYSGSILAITAHAMSGDRAKCLAVGCDDYASKPVDRAKLLAKVAALRTVALAVSPSA